MESVNWKSILTLHEWNLSINVFNIRANRSWMSAIHIAFSQFQQRRFFDLKFIQWMNERTNNFKIKTTNMIFSMGKYFSFHEAFNSIQYVNTQMQKHGKLRQIQGNNCKDTFWMFNANEFYANFVLFILWCCALTDNRSYGYLAWTSQWKYFFFFLFSYAIRTQYLLIITNSLL